MTEFLRDHAHYRRSQADDRYDIEDMLTDDDVVYEIGDRVIPKHEEDEIEDLIGVPLGIKARRRDTSTGLIFSLGIGAAYFVAGSMITTREDTQWLLWIPNLLAVLLGIFLFRRARFR